MFVEDRKCTSEEIMIFLRENNCVVFVRSRLKSKVPYVVVKLGAISVGWFLMWW